MIGLLLCSDSTATPKNHEFIALARQFQIHKKLNQIEEQENERNPESAFETLDWEF